MRETKQIGWLMVLVLLCLASAPRALAAKTEVAVQVKPDTLTEADAVALEKAGIHAVRFGVYYSPDLDSEEQKAPEWARYDRLFTLLKKHHVRVLMTAYAPPMVVAGQLKAKGVAIRNGVYDAIAVRETLHQDLDVLVRSAVTRYGAQLLGIEIWNEPDNRRFWTTEPQLGPFAAAMGGICETAKTWPKIPLYGFGFIFLPGGENTTTPLYDELKKTGATGCVAVSGHFYREHAELLVSEIEAARKYTGVQMVAITEQGASSLPGKRTEAEQADVVMRMLMSSIMADASLASMYEFKDTADATPEREKHFGFLRSDGTEKPLYAALKNFLVLYNAASTARGSCKDATCRFDMQVGGEAYAVFWREDAKAVPLNQWVHLDEIDSKLLRATDDFYTSSAEILTVTQSPLLVRLGKAGKP